MLLAAGLAAGAVAGLAAPVGLLQWQAGSGQAWRWWTAAFAHLGTAHLLANLAGCAVVGAFGATARLERRWALAWAAAWPVTHACLGLLPGLQAYAGLSAVLHAGVAVAALALAAQGRCRAQAIGLAVRVGTLAKVALERPWEGVVQAVPGWDFPVAVGAHAVGVACGLACASVALAIPRVAAALPR